MAFIDPGLVAELSATVLGVTQAIKNRPRLKKLDGEVIAVAVGTLTGLVWFLSRGEIIRGLSWHQVSWSEAFTAAVNGLLGGVAASTGFNLQKVLPVPNLLLTRSEKNGGTAWNESTNSSETLSDTPTSTDGSPSPP